MKTLRSTTFTRFDTLCQLSADVDEAVLGQAERLCARLERVYSRFDPQSSLSRVNAAAGEWVTVERELADTVRTARAYSEATAGLFDITMGSLCAIWDFKRAVVPAPEDIDTARAHVDWREVEVDGDRVRLRRKGAFVDLGGIAKGVIADALADFLVREGAATSGYINLGGNVLVIGSKPDGQPWSVGLRAPAPSPDPFQAPLFAAVAVRGKSVVTSGVFERAFVSDGQLLHHILDPRTGAPAVTDVLSATVLSDRSTEGDALATALVIMGSEAALDFVERTPTAEAILYAADGRILHTSGVFGANGNYALAS